ncbi:MAG: hypothetical protein ABJB33_00970 [Gemmatimonadota bacterium]
MALFLAGCAHGISRTTSTPGSTTRAPTAPVAVRRVPHDEAEPVEVGGIAPNDTVVTIHRGEARVVIMRHGPPDRTEFVELTLPSTVFAKDSKDSVRVTIKTRPGMYGVDLSADADWGPGTEIAFKYAVHFYPPAGSLRQYRALTEVDRRLTVARREENGDLTIYHSTHPAPDVLRALIPGDGTYVMVVGK